MIVSKTITLEAELPVDNVYIENELIDSGIEPLRWAVVAVEGNVLTVSVSYQSL